jgi:acetyl-CoA acetyltransferase
MAIPETQFAARDRCAIAGIGTTEFSKDSGRSSLRLAAEAARAAIADAGLRPEDIDGIVRCDFDTTTTAALAATLGMKDMRFWADTGPGGTAPVMQLAIAVGALMSGQAKNVLVFRALNGRSEGRLGTGVPGMGGARVGGQGRFDEFYLPWGLISAGQTFALVAQEHMRRYGTTQEHLGRLAIICREAANRTPHAQMHGRTLTMEEYLDSRPISLPLRLFDFCLETDGAVAAVVTTTERARDMPQPPALIRALAGGMPRDMRAGMMFPVLSRDMLEFGARAAGEELWKRAGIGPAEIDVAQIYDCFTISLLVQIEAFGFCEVGEAGALIESGALGHGGSMPINTAGGNMSEGYVHGMNHVIEAVRQVRGQAANQVAGAQTAFVSSGPLPVGAGAVIRSDR